jgi:hypothetical protein
LLKPGVSFLLFEPNSEYVLQFARSLWYAADGYFDKDTEDALAHDALLKNANGAFEKRSVRYFGGPAFFLIYNSLVLRVPHSVKRIIGPPLLGLERLYNFLPGRLPFSSFTAQWVRTSATEPMSGTKA